ncbi:conserved Plasmodium protein, unknown function [Plasmodium gallinaceum]|uniref:DUF2423 domain-containing protein n=1 Tax=Plasmodium gallinaceum TaxID=5849 RepID=A0A1J1GWI2_PLAGA|nr:conserved Plasmodium protein, unknown function [Plasmodium gallinaceum]CRG96677.1 conserved Plasmodium protein, unknown function [Plasmodium gallinaceum]
MAKGLRSKVKRRFRTIKRVHVNEVIEKPNLKKLNNKIKLMLNNKNIYEDLIKPPNKFLYPEDERAVIPQHKVTKKIDFRSEALPLSGLVTVGNRRKYSLNEKIELKNEMGNNPNFYDNIEVSKIIDDMHKRSREVMKKINKKEDKNEKRDF